MDKEYRVTSLEYVYLGRSGENLARTVKIDVSEWLDRWPGASIHILHRPRGSEDYYIADTTLEGGMLTWVIRAADGYTPVKGVDYYTEADKTELVQAVLNALPAAEGVSY